jgi:hypothetical protein
MLVKSVKLFCVYVCACLLVRVCVRALVCVCVKPYLSRLAKRCLKFFEVSESNISSLEFTIAHYKGTAVP